jgi:archaeosine synthase alpha-subunit
VPQPPASEPGGPGTGAATLIGMRTVTRLEGLALHGFGTVGPLRFPTPSLLLAEERPGLAAGPTISGRPAAPGERGLTLGDGQQSLELRLPILAPEIAPTGAGVFPVRDGVVLLHAPLGAEALRSLRASRPELVILGNARALWNDGSALVEALRSIRGELGAEPLLWAPRLALPHRLPLLVYLGIDLLDSTEGDLRAISGEFLDLSLGGRTAGTGGPERGCDCEACRSEPPGPLSAHAREMYRRSMREVDAALRRGELRELVEARLAAEPAAAEVLRYADRELAGLLESRAPVTSETSHRYVLAESQRRPEMRRFRERLLDRYRPPPSKSVLLLVPCSRTKPYRKSPSHRRFARALEGLGGLERVHLVSLSSPIGLVPRELEDVPPARNYDIPVTGDWSAEEREHLLRGLRHLLATGRYRHVVAHLDPVEYGFVLEALPDGIEVSRPVVGGAPTAGASIAGLRAAVGRALEGEPPVPGGPLAVVAEELRELASVQFGRAAAERLFARPLRLAGRPWFQRLRDGERDLASLREERGLFHLTVAGAARLGDAIARVDVEPALSLEGDLFAPGVLAASPEIRIGDAVGLFRDGRLAAVGEAALPGTLLGDLRRGLAVRVRHRQHEPADIAKTEEPRGDAGR